MLKQKEFKVIESDRLEKFEEQLNTKVNEEDFKIKGDLQVTNIGNSKHYSILLEKSIGDGYVG
jgi:hypothetical protein